MVDIVYLEEQKDTCWQGLKLRDVYVNLYIGKV